MNWYFLIKNSIKVFSEILYHVFLYKIYYHLNIYHLNIRYVYLIQKQVFDYKLTYQM